MESFERLFVKSFWALNLPCLTTIYRGRQSQFSHFLFHTKIGLTIGLCNSAQKCTWHPGTAHDSKFAKIPNLNQVSNIAHNIYLRTQTRIARSISQVTKPIRPTQKKIRTYHQISAQETQIWT